MFVAISMALSVASGQVTAGNISCKRLYVWAVDVDDGWAGWMDELVD